LSDFEFFVDSQGDNIDPPNPADVQNPAQQNYFRQSISRGCTPDNAYPFSYTPHYAQYVNPVTANISNIVVVPAAMAMSWDGMKERLGMSAR